jgi:hypothetical protein
VEIKDQDESIELTHAQVRTTAPLVAAAEPWLLLLTIAAAAAADRM